MGLGFLILAFLAQEIKQVLFLALEIGIDKQLGYIKILNKQDRRGVDTTTTASNTPLKDQWSAEFSILQYPPLSKQRGFFYLYRNHKNNYCTRNRFFQAE